MNKGSSKAERTRAFIIEQTADLFNKRGFAGTSISDLTGATGLTKGSIYGNFENKEEIALAVFDYNYSRLVKQVQAEIGKATTYRSKLMVYGKAYRQIMRAFSHSGGCPVLNTAVEADDTHPQLKSRAAAGITRWKKNIVKLIDNGIRAGEFKKDLRTEQTAVSIIALIEGGLMMARVTGDWSHLDQALETVELLINRLLK